MKWIKYQILCNVEENILTEKRIGYSDANLVIAQAEAYKGEYTIEDDGKTFNNTTDFNADIDMNGHKVKNLCEPVDDNDASNKRYVDNIGEALVNNQVLINNVADVVKTEVPFIKTAEHPIFVNSISECTDTSKVYVLPDGYIYAYMRAPGIITPNFTNLAEPNATNTTDPSIWINNTSLNSGGDADVPTPGNIVTNFIPCNQNDIVRFEGLNVGDNINGLYNLGKTNMSAPKMTSTATTSLKDKILTETGGQCTIARANTSYIRFGGVPTGSIDDVVITVNEEITYTTIPGGYRWANTGVYFVRSNYDDEIEALEDNIETLDQSVDALEHSIDSHDKRLDILENTEAPTPEGYAKCYFLSDLSGLFSAPTTVSGGSTNDDVDLVSSNVSVIYNIYDSLVSAYPNYVTKTKLGDVTDGLSIYKYTFSDGTFDNQSAYPHKKLKIIVQAGIHGYEQGSAWCLAQFMKLLCDNDGSNDILTFIHDNVDLVVVPVANPYGFNNNQRMNANGIDINRNFDADWKLQGSGTEYYGGANPASEIETQILTQFIDDNLDADWVLDYHNISGGYPMCYVKKGEFATICRSVSATLSRKWRSEYSGFPRSQMLGYCKTGSNATFVSYCIKRGLNAFTVETPWTMPVIGSSKYDKPTILTSMEFFVNVLMAILKSYK